MITSLPTSLSFVAASHSLAPARKGGRCVREVAVAQPLSLQPLAPPASLWPASADARANQVLNAYRRTGGLATGDEMTLLLRAHTAQPISMLARWIVERRVVSFAWLGEYLLPMFQFEGAELGVRRSVAAVLEEFDGTFEDWDLASWFALPNTWLDDEAPVDALVRHPHAVLQAARADRFIARG